MHDPPASSLTGQNDVSVVAIKKLLQLRDFPASIRPLRVNIVNPSRVDLSILKVIGCIAMLCIATIPR
jgi:hypothetical protein